MTATWEHVTQTGPGEDGKEEEENTEEEFKDEEVDGDLVLDGHGHVLALLQQLSQPHTPGVESEEHDYDDERRGGRCRTC